MLVRVAQRAPLIRAAAIAAAIAIPGTQAAAQQPASSVPATHTVKRGDTLWDIAKMYLGDPFLWPEIYRLNTDVIEDPHWIYPGEVLKLVGATVKVIAVTPPPPAAEVAPPTSRPAAFAPSAAPTPVQRPASAPVPTSTVRSGEYAAAPWVDQRGGPRNSGYIMQNGDLPGIASADRSRMQLYDRIVVVPPVGSVAPEKELYLSYRLGPLIEEFGQIVIPTGIIEITRAPRNGEAALARVVKVFDEMMQGHRLLPLDTSAAIVVGGPIPVATAAQRVGKIRWIYKQPVLPSIQSYVVVDLSGREGVKTGDQIELFMPRYKRDDQELAIPETSIALAQVLRVTPYGATAIIMSQEQPKIQDGTAARVSAKMP
jgi:LysM repeat protein